jgi:hypothetical protein
MRIKFVRDDYQRGQAKRRRGASERRDHAGGVAERIRKEA